VNLVASTGSDRNPFQYTGREFDFETGLRYHRARYYDPQVRRFISEDPIGLRGGINKYAYTGNNPVNAIDPTGLKAYVDQFPNGNIRITVPIAFYGNAATQELVKMWIAQIMAEWNGHNWNGCQVNSQFR
jgi:RHS repeat-associated protein